MTEQEKRLLWHEVGLKIIEQARSQSVLDAHRGRVVFPRCPHCKRRPELRAGDTGQLLAETGLAEPKFAVVPRYFILRCCSATYAKQIEHVTRRQKRQAADEVRKREEAQGVQKA